MNLLSTNTDAERASVRPTLVLMAAVIVCLAGQAGAASITLNPSGAGSYSAWTWTGGSANYTNWQTPDDDDTTYAVATAKNQVQTAALDNASYFGVINSVTVYVRLRHTPGAIEPFAFTLVDDAGTYTSGNYTPTASYAAYSENRTTRSNGTAWTWTAINALEAGVQSMASGGYTGYPRVTSVYVVVDYTPNVAPSLTMDNDFAALSSGTVRVNYKLADSNSDSCDLTNRTSPVTGVEYSTDGSTWYDATMGAGGDGSTGLASSASPGTQHKFAWSSASDLAGIEDNSVYIRMAPFDSFEAASSWANTSAFAIDNKAPAVATAIYMTAAPVSGDTSFQLDAAFTEGNPNTNVYAYNLNNAGYATGNGSANTADPAVYTFNVALDGADRFTGIKCTHADDIGNSVVSEDTTVIYVKPLVPQAPTLGSAAQTMVPLTVNANASEAGSGIYYVIKATSAAGVAYVTADGSLGPTPVWGNAWPSPVTVTGLSENTQYWFAVAAGNPYDTTPTEGENSASAYGPWATITTLPPPPKNLELTGELDVSGLILGN